jgi:hypothetical protein
MMSVRLLRSCLGMSAGSRSLSNWWRKSHNHCRLGTSMFNSQWPDKRWILDNFARELREVLFSLTTLLGTAKINMSNQTDASRQ